MRHLRGEKVGDPMGTRSCHADVKPGRSVNGRDDFLIPDSCILAKHIHEDKIATSFNITNGRHANRLNSADIARYV
jgi:hypothetical protein